MKMMQLGVVVVAAVCVTSGVSAESTAAESTPFCADGGAGADVDPGCISFEEAGSLADDPASGVHRITTRNEPTLGSFVTASADDSDAICSEGSCYVRGQGTVTLHATATTQTVFLHWSGCSESVESLLTVGPLDANADCVANFGPGLIVVSATAQGRNDGAQPTVRSGSCGGQQSCTLMSGNSATISAPPSDLRYRFLGWSGCSASVDPTLVLTNLTQAVEPCVARYERRTLPRLWRWR